MARPRRSRRARRRDREERTCEMRGCDDQAVRSLPIKKVRHYLSDKIEKGVSRRVHVCKEHYKEYKKSSKKDRELERLGRRDGVLDPH